MFEDLLPIALPEGLPERSFLDDARRIMDSHRLTNASFVRELEQAAAKFLDVPHCVAVSNCTTALMLVLRALNLHGEVIVPSFTFYATAHAILWNDLKPVFADCDPLTFCVDAESVRKRITSRTAAIVAVHVFGNPAEVRGLEEIASNLSIPLVYDAAHAFGSSTEGVRIGGFGTAEVFSFSPTKLVVAAEGGLIATRDASLARTLRAARNYGDAGTGDPNVVGLNGRMSEFHAALALRAIDSADRRIARRNEIRCRYENRLRPLPGLTFQTLPEGTSSSCKDFSLIVDGQQFGRSRDWLFQALRAEHIDVRRYFWPPVHRQKLYRDIWDGNPLPATDSISDRVISLPIYSSLGDADVDKVCDAIRRAADFARMEPAGAAS